jgi:predicted ester cyclase
MSPEDTKALGRQIVEAINSGNFTSFDKIFAAGYVDRTAPPGVGTDLAGFKQTLTALRAAFPDFRYTIEDEIAAGDRLVHRLTARGTQKGEFQGVPATGKQATWAELHIGRVVDGKVVEHWGLGDQQAIMKQLELAPALR